MLRVMLSVIGAILAMFTAVVLSSCNSDRAGSSASAQSGMERIAIVQDPAELGIGRSISFTKQDSLGGEPFNLDLAVKDTSALVVTMTSVGCPVSTKYAPRLAALESQFASRGVRFVYVNTVAAENLGEMREQVRRFGFKGPYLPDRSRAVVGALSARTTAEVFVIDPAKTLIYRGAVDDQFGVGTALDQPKRLFLRDVIESVLAKRPPAVAATWAPGCLLDVPVSRGTAVADELTYYGRISRILDASCIDCHRSGGAAPFSLTSPSLIDGRATMIEAVVRDGLMPPSHGVARRPDGTSAWLHRHDLSTRDRDDLLEWLRLGRPTGDAGSAMVPRNRPIGWAIGMPDQILMTPGLILEKEGPMRHERFTIATRIDGDQWITAVEFKPVKPGTIHHALVWLLPPGVPIPLPDDMPTTGFLGAFSPGSDLIEYPRGVARRFPVGSILLVDVYARPMGSRMGVSLRVGMKTSPVASGAFKPTHEIRSFTIQAAPFELVPGVRDVKHTAEFALPQDSTLVALTPYLRSRGRSVSLEARLPDSSIRSLLDAPKYDFRWPSRFEFAIPETLPTGTKLLLRGVHDNSIRNLANPDAAVTVKTGSSAFEESLAMHIEWQGIVK